MMTDRIEKRVLEVANYTIRTGSTIRDTAKVFGVGKSTIHLDLSERLPKIDKSLSEKVNIILSKNFNEKHIRGGEATRKRYQRQKDRRLAI